jgi:hypothetical protein
MTKKEVLYSFIFVSVIFFCFTFFDKAVGANKPMLVVTWETQSYAPESYTGKILPGVFSDVKVAVGLVSETGKITSLKNKNIAWYLDDENEKNGVGADSFSFRPSTVGNHEVRVEIPDYGLKKTVSLAVVNPQAVVRAPWPSGQFFLFTPTLKAIPYYFNVADLKYLSPAWIANGQSPSNSEDPWHLVLNLPTSTPDGTAFDINLTIKNLTQKTETSGKNINIIFRR